MVKVSYAIRGGTLESHGLKPPFTRMFDDRRRKRKVDVYISGFTCGGLHYYVTIEEEENPILGMNDKSAPAWISASDDTEKKGGYNSKRCNTVSDAENYIKKILKKYPRKTHHYKIRNYAPENVYVKEGD